MKSKNVLNKVGNVCGKAVGERQEQLSQLYVGVWVVGGCVGWGWGVGGGGIAVFKGNATRLTVELSY